MVPTNCVEDSKDTIIILKAQQCQIYRAVCHNTHNTHRYSLNIFIAANWISVAFTSCSELDNSFGQMWLQNVTLWPPNIPCRCPPVATLQAFTNTTLQLHKHPDSFTPFSSTLYKNSKQYSSSLSGVKGGYSRWHCCAFLDIFWLGCTWVY